MQIMTTKDLDFLKGVQAALEMLDFGEQAETMTKFIGKVNKLLKNQKNRSKGLVILSDYLDQLEGYIDDPDNGDYSKATEAIYQLRGIDNTEATLQSYVEFFDPDANLEEDYLKPYLEDYPLDDCIVVEVKDIITHSKVIEAVATVPNAKILYL